MKKLISTSLAFLSIVTSSASFPNQLSAIENKSNSGSNIKFYLKRASNILCTILPAFIASAIFKSRTQPQTSIIPEKKQIEEIKKQGENIKEQIEEIKKQREEETKKQGKDIKGQIEEIKKQGEDIKEQIEEIKKQREEGKDIKGQIEETKKQGKDIKGQIEETKKQGKYIKEQIEETKKQGEDIKKQIEELKKQGKDIKGQIEEIKKQREEEIKKQGEDIKEQIEKIKKQIEDLKEQIGEDIKEQGKDIKEQIEAINNRAVRQQRQQRIQREQEETQAKERQANLASSLTKKNVSRDQIQIVDLTEDSFNIPEGTKAKNIADNMKNYYTGKFERNQEGNIKYMIWSKLKEQNVTSDNLMNKIYKYNNSFYKILGCADLYTKDDSQEINFPFNNSRNKCLYAYNLIRATLYYNHDFGNPLVISLVPYNVNLAAQV